MNTILWCVFVLMFICLSIQAEDEQPGLNVPQNFKLRKEWMPLIISECLPGMHEKSAPCLKEKSDREGTNIVFGQELIYPSYAIRLPGFIKGSEDRATWLDIVVSREPIRVSGDGLWAEYPVLTGQNLVFSNTSCPYTMQHQSWGPETIGCNTVSHHHFLRAKESASVNKKAKYLIFGSTADAGTFQHFQDHVLPAWLQAQNCIPERIIVEKQVLMVTNSPLAPVPREMSLKMGLEHILLQHYNKGALASDYLVFPARTPLFHPWLFKGISDALGWQEYSKPIEERKDIIFLGRSTKYGVERNPGRSVLNQEELLNAVAELLARRNQGERLVSFDDMRFASMHDTVKYFAGSVRGIMGPHGGKFYNARFASPGTVVIEFLPKQRFDCMFWRLSATSDLDYHVVMTEAVDSVHNMVVDSIDAIVDVLDARLGNPFDPAMSPRKTYPWIIE